MPSRVISIKFYVAIFFLQYSVNKELKFCGFRSLTTPKKLTANYKNLIFTWRDGLLIELFLFVFFTRPVILKYFSWSLSCFVIYLQDEFRLILSCSEHDNHFLLHTCSFQVDLPSVFRSLMCIYVLTPYVYPVHICIQLACPVDRTTEYTRSIDRNILHQYSWAAPYKSG